MKSKKWDIQSIPNHPELETRKVLKSLPSAYAALSELKGVAQTIPNQAILINALGLREAKDSSAIENIITTHDELYKSELNLKSIKSLEAKEVQNYIAALKKGYALTVQNNLLSNRMIREIQSTLEKNQAGFRKIPGTSLKNSVSGEIIYTPPQNHEEIILLMTKLEKYINTIESSGYDPLVKMAIIHFQFESIHPFYDGNGRTGRIINILYLILNKLLDSPILYLSSYIIKNKSEYYRLLQQVRDTNNWEDWLLFMTKGVEETSRGTIKLIKTIKEQMLRMKRLLRENYKFYSQDLLNNLFKHPYTKIEFVVEDLQVSRLTAANYLNKLSADGVLRKEKLGVSNYYVNEDLFKLLSEGQL
jgi:Fic family protein